MSILVTKTVEGGCRTILPFDELSLQDIPCLLKKMGWNTAANLMDHWFSTTPAFEMDDFLRDKYMVGKAIDIPKKHYNDSILKMTWAIRYKQIQDAINVLINEKLNNVQSNKAIFSRLLERNKILSPLNNKKIPIGYCSNIIDIDYTSQVNWTQFGVMMVCYPLVNFINIWHSTQQVHGVHYINNTKDMFLSLIEIFDAGKMKIMREAILSFSLMFIG